MKKDIYSRTKKIQEITHEKFWVTLDLVGKRNRSDSRRKIEKWGDVREGTRRKRITTDIL